MQVKRLSAWQWLTIKYAKTRKLFFTDYNSCGIKLDHLIMLLYLFIIALTLVQDYYWWRHTNFPEFFTFTIDQNIDSLIPYSWEISVLSKFKSHNYCKKYIATSEIKTVVITNNNWLWLVEFMLCLIVLILQGPVV